ncbi:MAG: hypothetical protein GWN31_14910 [Candidatus Thorarchaeota archaeon]|nr:hypothetical protein [Candidatus Thorarchaeota archaeon]NIW15184.1 hypothetical protein [Candidatus Thorarchaeota archaeon]NIW53173.1 hypothetical protein [Candidatus Korarchaeota archaeon]
MNVDIKLTTVREFLAIPRDEFVKEWKKLSDTDKEEIKSLVAKEISE